MVLLTACADTRPPIGRGGPKLAADMAAWFDARVQTAFPVGSDDKKLSAELHRQGFAIRAVEVATRYPVTATYQANEIVCRERWTIRWSSAQGKIVDITGEWSQTCL